VNPPCQEEDDMRNTLSYGTNQTMQVEARVLQYQEFHVTNVGDESTAERA
jgi:hypothetical protein